MATLTAYIFRMKHDTHNWASALTTTRGLLHHSDFYTPLGCLCPSPWWTVPNTDTPLGCFTPYIYGEQLLSVAVWWWWWRWWNCLFYLAL